MANTLRIIKAVVMLAIAAFIIMVIVGVYTALDAAPSYSLATSANASDTAGDSAEQAAALALDKVGDAADEATDAVASSALSASGDESGSASLQPSSVASAGSANSFAGDSTTDTSSGNNADSSSDGSSNSGGGSSSGGSNAATPAPSTPAKTYHPAWDEWVESGYYETRTIPASYGQRDTFGSVCNDCGADISGHAAQHLRDTHHSGYHEGVVGNESYEITPARTEQIWVDTSHWVRHEAYYD